MRGMFLVWFVLVWYANLFKDVQYDHRKLYNDELLHDGNLILYIKRKWVDEFDLIY